MTTPPPNFGNQPDPAQQPGAVPQYSAVPPPQVGMPQYAAVPPQPPAKKSKKWPWIVGAIAVLLLIVALTSGGDDSSSSSSDSNGSPNASGGRDAGDAAAGLNTPVRDGKFEFVVSGYQDGLSEVGENQYLTEEAQGQFVVVSLTVQNIGDKPQSFSPSNQKLIDAQGRSFESSSMAQIALGGSDITVWDNINPGNTVNVKLVFDMPKDATPSTLELHDSMLSNGVKISLT